MQLSFSSLVVITIMQNLSELYDTTMHDWNVCITSRAWDGGGPWLYVELECNDIISLFGLKVNIFP